MLTFKCSSWPMGFSCFYFLYFFSRWGIRKWVWKCLAASQGYPSHVHKLCNLPDMFVTFQLGWKWSTRAVEMEACLDSISQPFIGGKTVDWVESKPDIESSLTYSCLLPSTKLLAFRAYTVLHEASLYATCNTLQCKKWKSITKFPWHLFGLWYTTHLHCCKHGRTLSCSQLPDRHFSLTNTAE